MKSQVSFVFDGSHNTSMIKSILKDELKGVKTFVETINNCTYRIYVSSKETKEKVMHVCRGIQCYSVYDDTKEL